jgi:two-component system OmpR family response regulator
MPIRSQIQRTKILVVDDQHDLADMLSHALTDQGYDVTTCTSGREAVAMIKILQPAAVLLDVMMPETDGFAVLRELRSNTFGERLPVILMSAAWRTQEKQRHVGSTLSIAPTVVLPKPFALADLDKCLQQLGVFA